MGQLQMGRKLMIRQIGSHKEKVYSFEASISANNQQHLLKCLIQLELIAVAAPDLIRFVLCIIRIPFSGVAEA